MCGIVGLLVKNPALRNHLGALMVPMLVGMTERGPDSAGLAVYTAPVSAECHKLSLYSGENAVDWTHLLARIAADFSEAQEISGHGNHAVLTSATDPTGWLPGSRVMRRTSPCSRSASRSISIKTSALPRTLRALPVQVVARFSSGGAHADGDGIRRHARARASVHRRAGFLPGSQWFIVQSASGAEEIGTVGIEFETDNDTEAACRFFEWRLREATT